MFDSNFDCTESIFNTDEMTDEDLDEFNKQLDKVSNFNFTAEELDILKQCESDIDTAFASDDFSIFSSDDSEKVECAKNCKSLSDTTLLSIAECKANKAMNRTSSQSLSDTATLAIAEYKANRAQNLKTKRKSWLKAITLDFIPTKHDKPIKLILKGFVLVAYTASIISVGYIVRYFWESFEAKQDQKMIQAIRTEVVQNEETTSVTSDTVESDIAPIEKVLSLTNSAKELLKVNKDTVGYIRIPDTGVDGVVVQCEDNDYYLNHNVYNEKRQCGTLFVDYRCSIGQNNSQNIIIYGHNQYDGTMFGDLDFYRWNLDYWKKNPIVYFDTNYESNAYVIVASFVTNAIPEDDNNSIFDYQNYINFNTDFPFSKWYDEVISRTEFYTNIDFQATDSYITLSTCSTEWEPSRHVMIARKLRSNETVSTIDTSGWWKNPNPRYPQKYYDLYGGGETWEPTT